MVEASLEILCSLVFLVSWTKKIRGVEHHRLHAACDIAMNVKLTGWMSHRLIVLAYDLAKATSKGGIHQHRCKICNHSIVKAAKTCGPCLPALHGCSGIGCTPEVSLRGGRFGASVIA